MCARIAAIEVVVIIADFAEDFDLLSVILFRRRKYTC